MESLEAIGLFVAFAAFVACAFWYMAGRLPGARPRPEDDSTDELMEHAANSNLINFPPGH